MRRLSNLIIAGGALFALGAFVTQASAVQFHDLKATEAQVKGACDKVGGSFDTNASGYSCVNKNCDKKGGECGVYCSNSQSGNNCTGVTPALTAGKGAKKISRGTAWIGQVLRNTNVTPPVAGSPPASVARISGGGPGGAGFSCNEPGNPGRCSCTGPIDSQDCKDMSKNCDGDITCGWLVQNCTCKHKSSTLIGGKKKNFRIPTGGILDGGQSAPSGSGPAATGRPVAPPAPPPVIIR
jgi:hypothetical protein